MSAQQNNQAGLKLAIATRISGAFVAYSFLHAPAGAIALLPGSPVGSRPTTAPTLKRQNRRPAMSATSPRCFCARCCMAALPTARPRP